MKTIILALTFSSILLAADLYVCDVNPPSPAPPCGTYAPHLYPDINHALAAASSGDRVLIVPQSGNSADTGHLGAHCGGNDNCTSPAAIALTYPMSGVTLTTANVSRLPASGSRITLEYLEGRQPVAAEVRNPTGHKMSSILTMTYGSQSCDQLRWLYATFHPGGAAFSLVGATTSGGAGTWAVMGYAAQGYPTTGGTLTEDTSTGYHYARYPVTGSSTNYASVILGRTPTNPRQVALCLTAPVNGKCAIGDPTAGALVGSCPAGTTCGLIDWGQAPNHVNPNPATPHEYKLWIAWDSSIAGDPAVYVALASSGATSYTGTGSGNAFVWDPRFVPVKITDPDFGSKYTCAPHDITIEGLAFTGGNDGSTYPIVSLAHSLAYDAEMTAGEESPYNITFDRNIISNDPVLELARNPLETSTRHVLIENNYFATAYRSGSDGSVCCGQIQGPGMVSNNYMEALPSGMGAGGAANPIHTTPAAVDDFPQACCSLGWNGTVTFSNNFIWKPEWARAHRWAANYFVSKNSMWTPSGGSYSMHFIAQNSGTTGATEPAWKFWSGSSVVDGGVVWAPESDPVFTGGTSCTSAGFPASECYTLATLNSYGAGSYVSGSVVIINPAGSPNAWMASNTGTAAGAQTTALNTACTQGQTVVDGGVTWRCLGVWAAGKTFLPNDRVNYPAGGSGALYYIAAVGGVSGGSAPMWSSCATEGCTLVDGGVTWVGSFKAGNIYTSKNLMDFKECRGCVFQQNYLFNAFAQNRSGGNQGNCAEWSTQPSAGGTWEENTSSILGNVFDKCEVGLLLFGFDPGGNADFTAKGLGCTGSPNYNDPTATCYWNVNPGNTHDMTVQNNRLTNVMQGLSYNGCDLFIACGGSQNIAFGVYSGVQRATIDHNTFDAGGAAQSTVFIGDNESCATPQYAPDSGIVFSNNIMNPVSGTNAVFRSSCWGDDFPALNQNWNITFNAPTHIADGWPSFTSVAGTTTYHGVTVNQSAYSNLFINGISAGSLTKAAQTGADTLPTENFFSPTTWAGIGFNPDYSIPSSSPAYHIGLDGNSPGADPTQQALVNNVTASASGTTATICYDLTNANVSVPVMLQLSLNADFGGTGWVPAVLDPSLVAPAGGATVNSSNFPGYTQSGNHRCYIVSGLAEATRYYYRLHAGGQLYGALAENNPPPSFATPNGPGETQIWLGSTSRR